jgi:Transposase DDE domain
MTSVLRLMGLTLSAPDHSTVSHRAVTSPVIQPAQVPRGPLHVLIDSTGLQVYGAGANGWRRSMARSHAGRGASCIWRCMRPAA